MFYSKKYDFLFNHAQKELRPVQGKSNKGIGQDKNMAFMQFPYLKRNPKEPPKDYLERLSTNYAMFRGAPGADFIRAILCCMALHFCPSIRIFLRI